MCSDDFDPPACFSVQSRRARKDHRCCECRHLIPVGEVYVHMSGVWDGRPDSFKRHEACDQLAHFVQDVVCGGHGEILLGGLEEEIEEAGEYLDQDRDAWEAAGLPVPSPMREVFEFIRASYPCEVRS